MPIYCVIFPSAGAHGISLNTESRLAPEDKQHLGGHSPEMLDDECFPLIVFCREEEEEDEHKPLCFYWYACARALRAGMDLWDLWGAR